MQTDLGGGSIGQAAFPSPFGRASFIGEESKAERRRRKDAERLEQEALQRAAVEDMSEKDVAREIKRLEKLMLEHARNLEFEQAARVRDQLARLKDQAFGAHGSDSVGL